jgi:O-antigen ligase
MWIAALFNESVVVNALKKACVFLLDKYRESVFINLILRFFDWLGEKVRESKIYDWLGKSVFTVKYYEDSIFYRVLNGIWNLCLNIVRPIGEGIGKLVSQSLTGSALKKYLSCDTCLALFIGLMFIIPHSYWNNLYCVLAAVLFAIWVCADIATGRISCKRAEGVSLSLIVFAAAVCVSAVTALVVSDAFRIMLFMFGAILLMLEVYASLDTREKLFKFIKIVLAFVTLTAVIGFIQRAMGVEVDLEFVDVSANEGMPGRVFSTFSNPNNFAEMLLLFIPFFVPLFLGVKKKSEKTAVVAGFVITLGALIMTYSRSCWVGFALCALLFIVLYDKRLLIPAAIIVIVAIPFMPEAVINRIFTIGSLEDSSNSYRLYIWDSCFRMVKDFFVTGIGLGPSSFRVVYPDYAEPFAITAPHSHMLYMELILETGLLGFVSFFAYMFTVVKSAAGAMRKCDIQTKCVIIASLSALLGIAFVCCAEYIWFYPRVLFAFWIIPGIMMAAKRTGTR